MEQAAPRPKQTPKQLRYVDILPTGESGRQYIRKLNPSNGNTFTPGQTVTLDVKANGFLDCQHSYLQFTVTNNSSNDDFRLNESAYDFIQRWQLSGPDGTQIDNINEFGTLASVWTQFQMSKDYKEGAGSIMMGTSPTVSFATTTESWDTLAAAAASLPAPVSITESSDAAQDEIARTASRTYTVPLVGFLANDKMIPLHRIANGGLRLDLELASARNAVRTSSENSTSLAIAGNGKDDLSYEISNVQLCMSVVRMSEPFEARFSQLLGQFGKVEMHNHAWNHYLASYPGSQGTIVTNVNERARSLKSIIGLYKPSSFYSGAGNSTSIGSVPMTALRYHGSGVQTIQSRIGNELYPQEALSTARPGEVFAELLHALGQNIGDVDGVNCDVSINDYTRAVAYTEPTAIADEQPYVFEQRCKFVWGLDMEAYQDNLESGTNTKDRGLDVEITLNDSANFPAGFLHMYTLSDQIVDIQADGLVRVHK